MLSRIKYLVVSASACLTILLVTGSVASKGADQSDTLKHIGVFSDVVAHIKSEYVEEPDMKSVTLGALNGLLEAIDPFASYLNADQYQDYLKNKDVKRADVGLVLSKKPGWMGVVGTLPGFAGRQCGLVHPRHDREHQGHRHTRHAAGLRQLVAAGGTGPTVELSVVRVRHPEPQTITLTRANLTIPPVETDDARRQVGYIGIACFDVRPGQARRRRHPPTAEGRRAETGGGSAQLLGGHAGRRHRFRQSVPGKGRITYLKGQRVPQQNFDADPAKAITALPLAVLTNHGTADGAEIAAAALAGNKRAQLVGERTYGDAALRRALTMDDGGAIILSVAKYYSPDGKAIQDTGVTPGTAVADAEPQIEYDDNGEPINEPEPQPAQPKKLEDDPVVKKAVEVLSVVAKA